MLRSLLARRLSLTVGWMLTPDDGGPDGEVRGFLSNPKNRLLDPELFAWIEEWMARGGVRDVAEIERSGLLGAVRFHSSPLADREPERDMWFLRLRDIAAGTDAVFLDPDNGFEVESITRGARRSSKYVYWQEVVALFRIGVSVIVYQHLPRVSRQEFVRRVRDRAMQHRLPEPLVLVTSGVDYFAFIQPQHGPAIRGAFSDLASRSDGRLEIFRPADEKTGSDAPPITRAPKRSGVTTTPGFVNRNRQTVIGRCDAAPSLHAQQVYVLHCGTCGHEYGANGCDVFQRRCPQCQGGARGIEL